MSAHWLDALGAENYERAPESALTTWLCALIVLAMIYFVAQGMAQAWDLDSYAENEMEAAQ